MTSFDLFCPRSTWLTLLSALFITAATSLAQTPKAAAKGPPPIPPLQEPTAYALENAFPGLKFEHPLGIITAPEGKDRLFIIERAGRVQMLTGLASGKPAKQLYLDFTNPRDGAITVEGECGLLGLAFHPDYARNGLLFIYYSLKIDGKLHQRVSRLQAAKDNPDQADAASEQALFTQEDPASNHNGGDLHFGPDGYLYITVGDGGSRNDTFDQARFINKGFHAAILRIDVDQKSGSRPPNPHPGIARDANGAAFYVVPADNPFVGATSHHGQAIDPETVRTEFWACGLRNVWRFCFDQPTGRLFAADVGQNLYEEVNLIVKGGDYGWSYREGFHPFTLGPGGADEPPDFNPIDPIFEYGRTTGLSITGGVVYHGSKHADLRDAYICADYAFGRIIAAREKQPQWQWEIIALEAGIAGIGVDPRDDEVLFANLSTGIISKLKRK